MISANNDLESLQHAYKGGCDDYMRKPFYIEELQMKIANLEASQQSKICFSENAVYDKKEKNLYLDGVMVTLTKNERLLLNLFLDNLNMTVSREQIFSFFEYDGEEVSDDALRSLVKRLRQKVGKESIQTIINEGYVLKA